MTGSSANALRADIVALAIAVRTPFSANRNRSADSIDQGFELPPTRWRRTQSPASPAIATANGNASKKALEVSANAQAPADAKPITKAQWAFTIVAGLIAN